MRRALPFLMLLLLIGLVACRGREGLEPFTDSRIPPGLDHRFYPPQGWTWGLIQIGEAPPVRYGVAGPARGAVGQVIILPGSDQTAEAWFETADDLIGHGYVVWVLEGSGQGGSGRCALPRDLVHAPSLDPDVAALMVLAAKVSGERPRFLIASGTAAPVAVRAAALGLGLDGMVLNGALLSPGPGSAFASAKTTSREAPIARLERQLGLGVMRAPGGVGWRREDRAEVPGASEASHLRWLSRQWQAANPDLRMGGPSVSWAFAYGQEVDAANAAWPRVKVRTLVIGPDTCRGAPNCFRIAEPAAAAGAQGPGDGKHAAFMAAVLGFIDPSGHGVAPATPRVTLDPNE